MLMSSLLDFLSIFPLVEVDLLGVATGRVDLCTVLRPAVVLALGGHTMSGLQVEHSVCI